MLVCEIGSILRLGGLGFGCIGGVGGGGTSPCGGNGVVRSFLVAGNDTDIQ